MSTSEKGTDMAAETPVAELHAGFSSPEATPTAWAEVRRQIDEAEVFWLSKNLRQNPQCILTTGQNGLDGLDVVVEGRAVEVGDGAELERDGALVDRATTERLGRKR
jgi:hypothetical protein